MSYYFNTKVFLGYELGNEVSELVEAGKVDEDFIDELQQAGIDVIEDIFYGEFFYVGRSISHADEDSRPNAVELPHLNAEDYMEVKNKLCQNPSLKSIIENRQPKLYHISYYN